MEFPISLMIWIIPDVILVRVVLLLIHDKIDPHHKDHLDFDLNQLVAVRRVRLNSQIYLLVLYVELELKKKKKRKVKSKSIELLNNE